MSKPAFKDYPKHSIFKTKSSMDTLRSMRAFVAVVDAGSFTTASRQLAATKPLVSRLISELEHHLRTRLLNRTTRQIALTEAGKRYLSRCRDILASVAEAEMEASEAHTKPAGTLKVHAMSIIGQHYVVPALVAFHERFPALTVDLTLSNNDPGILEEGYDVAIQVAPDALPDSNFISHRLGVIDRVLCAAPRYVERRGNPGSVEDLAAHVCLQLARSIIAPDRWLLFGPEGEHEFQLPVSRFKVNMPDAMAIALREGVGIGALPTLAVRSSLRTGSLVRVLPEYRLQKLNLYAVYASRKYLDAKIRAWIDFAREWITSATPADVTRIAVGS